MICDSTALAVINGELGDDFDHVVDRCKSYRDVLLKNRRDVIGKIKSQAVGESSTMCQTLSRVRDERLAVVSLRKEVERLKTKYAKFKEETENVRKTFQNLIDDLKCKCNRLMYFSCLQCVTRISNKMKTQLAGKFDKEAITSYTNLCKLINAMNESPCKHLLSYINQVIKYWQSLLERHCSEDFESVLKKINWPFTVRELSESKKLDNHQKNFQRSASMLLKVQLPKNNCTVYSDQCAISQLIEHFSQVSIPIAMLIVPFRKRFFFHFTGNKQTNRPDKPEWFLSRVLCWVRDYREFIVDWLAPVYKENDRNPFDCQHEFVMGLLQFVVIKLDSDLSHFQLEDVVFSHIVDETFAFEHELKKMYGYPDNYPSITEVLTQAHIFFKWINMERKFVKMKIDVILNGTNQWEVIAEDSNYFMTVCADSFLTLLHTMKQRYCVLRQPRHQLQFLKLQIDLLEEFKEKIVNDFNENQLNEFVVEMLCTLHYIAYVLNNWGTNMLFLLLLNHKCELENEVRNRSESENPVFLETAETVFDETISSYNSGIDHLLSILCENIMSKIKPISKEYKRDKWHIMNSISDENKYSITESGWIMYESFSEKLNSLSKKLPLSLFNKCWPTLVLTLSTFIFNDVLLANTFNKGGAQHLMCDVRYRLIPIISKYTTKPNIYIDRLLEGCKILCFEPNFKPVILTRNEASEILLRRIENQNSIDFS